MKSGSLYFCLFYIFLWTSSFVISSLDKYKLIAFYEANGALNQNYLYIK